MGNKDSRFTHLQLLPWGPAGISFDLRQLARQHWGRDWRYRIFSFLLSIIFLPLSLLERVFFGFQGQFSWAFPAVFHSLRLIRKRKPTVIYSTGGAYSAHLAGYILKRLTGITWIAEVHDPMIAADMKQNRNFWLMSKLEGYICRYADLAWWFTDAALKSARDRHPELGERGLTVLPGVEKLPSSAQYIRTSMMVVSYFGLLSENRSLLPIVEAVKTLLDRLPELRSVLRFHIYGGQIDSVSSSEINKSGLSDIFVSFGRLEQSPLTGKSGREQVIDLMYQSDFLLLLHGNFAACSEYIPSKFYEYLWAGRPIIALTHKNAQLDKMLHERKHYVAEATLQPQIVEALETAYHDWKLDQLPETTLPPLGVEQAVGRILNALNGAVIDPRIQHHQPPKAFTIIIPTWNNLPYLKLCIDSLKRHSTFSHEIIVHVNDGSDGTLDWVKGEGLKFSHSEKNVGICLSVNHLVTLATNDWVLYVNDDMVACPGWDTAFVEAIISNKTDLALYFSTLIQPKIGKNHHMVEHDFGSTPETFDSEGLLKNFLSEKREDTEGAISQPTLFHKKWWQIVGGYSLEFSPGMSSDDDLAMKFWVAGCRHFRIVGNSRFYHFVCKSTGRIHNTKGGRVFVMKWGITQGEFYRNYMSKLNGTSSSELTQKYSHLIPRATLIGRLRRAGYGLYCDYPLEGIDRWDPVSGQGSWQHE